ncbi:glycerophosphocholine phosphodiesterase GPCPD1 [Cochliomyia hominivorax]
MATTLRNQLLWCLYLLNFIIGLTNNLAQTTSFQQNLSEDNLKVNYSELEALEFLNSEDLLKNSTFTREGRHLKCVPLIKHFEVELLELLKPGEGVGLTGDHEKLGEWQIDKSLEMKRRRRNPLKWYLKIPMCSALRVYYRFFIYYHDSRGFKRIRYWEGQQHPRVLEAYEMYRHQGSQTFGHAHARAVGGGVQRERAWLRREYILQLKFIWPQHIRFTEFSHFIRNSKYILKLKAFGENRGGLDNYITEDTELQVSRFKAGKSNLLELKEKGEFYKPGDIVVFHITCADFQENLYMLGIYTRQKELLGEVAIPSEVIKSSEGILELPIYDPKETKKVGWLTLPFLRIEALPESLMLNMRSGFHHYWPYNWPTLDIGLRGLGKSFYYYQANAVENTIESFLKAQEIHSDMVQLDVQLTKDYVPVVWHDFGFYTTGSRYKKNMKIKDLKYVYIHDLTYEELTKKRVFMFIKGLMVELTHLNSELVTDKKRIFPTLREVYETLSITMGIMINIKWPQLLSTGTFESLQTLDKNLYVNEILQTTMKYGCGRPLIMASFDADICSMLRYKQHMFPVVFLTMGQYSPWESYADLRTHSLSNAIQFVQFADILGSSVYVKELLPEHEGSKDLQMAFDLQQLIFAWGDQLNESSVLEHFRNQELAGLIYSQIDSLMQQGPKTKIKRFSLFEAPELKRIFLRQCIAAGNITLGEGLPDTHTPFWPRLRSLDEL